MIHRRAGLLDGKIHRHTLGFTHDPHHHMGVPVHVHKPARASDDLLGPEPGPEFQREIRIENRYAKEKDVRRPLAEGGPVVPHEIGLRRGLKDLAQYAAKFAFGNLPARRFIGFICRMVIDRQELVLFVLLEKTELHP
jgi:hypothetical protein